MSSSEARADVAPLVTRRDEGGVVTLTLNRGERFNPLSAAMIAALEAALDAVAVDPLARAVVLAGAGRGFCAGHDLKEMRAHGEDKAFQRRLFADCSRMMLKLTESLSRSSLGSTGSPRRQAASSCPCATWPWPPRRRDSPCPGVNIGVFCSTPAVGVARNIGRKRTMEMLLTGDLFDAATALGWGLVNRVVPAAALDEEVGKFTSTIPARSGKVIARGKRAFYEQLEQPRLRCLCARERGDGLQRARGGRRGGHRRLHGQAARRWTRR